MQGIAVPGGRRPRRAASPEPQRAPLEGAFLVCWGTLIPPVFFPFFHSLRTPTFFYRALFEPFARYALFR